MRKIEDPTEQIVHLLRVAAKRKTAEQDGGAIFEVQNPDRDLLKGAAALISEQARALAEVKFAISTYFAERDAFREWHDANPGCSGGRYSREIARYEIAEEKLRELISNHAEPEEPS